MNIHDNSGPKLNFVWLLWKESAIKDDTASPFNEGNSWSFANTNYDTDNNDRIDNVG